MLEWRVDPASGYPEARLTERGFDAAIVLYCNDGYSSSLAAAGLRRLGFARVTDMRGGFAAWRSAGLPIATDP